MKKLWIVFVVFAMVAIAQEKRALVETANPEWQSFTCTKNADSSIECSGCVSVVDSDGDSRTECSRTFRLTATLNQNRANGLGEAVRARALKRFGVDGGSP